MNWFLNGDNLNLIYFKYIFDIIISPIPSSPYSHLKKGLINYTCPGFPLSLFVRKQMFLLVGLLENQQKQVIRLHSVIYRYIANKRV